jgi:hypothetical protein
LGSSQSIAWQQSIRAARNLSIYLSSDAGTIDAGDISFNLLIGGALVVGAIKHRRHKSR